MWSAVVYYIGELGQFSLTGKIWTSSSFHHLFPFTCSIYFPGTSSLRFIAIITDGYLSSYTHLPSGGTAITESYHGLKFCSNSQTFILNSRSDPRCYKGTKYSVIIG